MRCRWRSARYACWLHLNAGVGTVLLVLYSENPETIPAVRQSSSPASPTYKWY